MADSIESENHSHINFPLQAVDFCEHSIESSGETLVRMHKPHRIDSILKQKGFKVIDRETAIADYYGQPATLTEIRTYASPDSSIQVTLDESTITIKCANEAIVNAIGQSFMTIGFRKKGSEYGWPRVGDLSGICINTTPTSLTISAPNAPI